MIDDNPKQRVVLKWWYFVLGCSIFLFGYIFGKVIIYFIGG